MTETGAHEAKIRTIKSLGFVVGMYTQNYAIIEGHRRCHTSTGMVQ